MTNVILSADRKSWSVPVQHGSVWDKNKRMVRIRKKILSKYNNTCQGCGWKSKEFQEIHHKDGNHNNFKEDNLEVLCPFCHQVFHPALASLSNGGVMIWLPELSQSSFNKILIPLFCILNDGSKNDLFDVAKSLWGIFEKRKIFVENQIGKSDPAIFGQILLNLSKEEYQKREIFLKGIKMLAIPARFETEIDYWSQSVVNQKSTEKWLKEAKDIKLTQDI